ncbi:MAG: sterol desaturase family protein [Xanthomonadaceae bacterium]|nr:sterol desaturase family protein [Xanthomonadaceae bacterium]
MDTMLPVWLLPLVVTVVFLLLFALERRFPLRKTQRALWPRILVNVVMTGLAVATAAITVRPAVEQLLALSPEQHFGALALLELPIAVEFGIAFLLFDWSFYWWHRLNHRVPLLWRFHNVHHVDPDLDVTTAFRFHAVEIAYSSAFRATQVLLIGPAVWMYFMYELVFQVATVFQHSNVKLPVPLERALNRVLVTPRMHGVHHSHFHHETDSNYSSVFSWWDRLHRSLRLNVPQQAIQIGVPAYSQAGDNRPNRLLAMPFTHQRCYWQQPGGTSLEKRPASQASAPANRMLE